MWRNRSLVRDYEKPLPPYIGSALFLPQDRASSFFMWKSSFFHPFIIHKFLQLKRRLIYPRFREGFFSPHIKEGIYRKSFACSTSSTPPTKTTNIIYNLMNMDKYYSSPHEELLILFNILG